MSWTIYQSSLSHNVSVYNFWEWISLALILYTNFRKSEAKWFTNNAALSNKWIHFTDFCLNRTSKVGNAHQGCSQIFNDCNSDQQLITLTIQSVSSEAMVDEGPNCRAVFLHYHSNQLSTRALKIRYRWIVFIIFGNNWLAVVSAVKQWCHHING